MEVGTGSDMGAPNPGDRLKRVTAFICTVRREQGAVAALLALSTLIAAKVHILLRRLATLPRRSVVRVALQSARGESHQNLIIAILSSGGIGDLVILGRFLRDLQIYAGPYRFDIYYPRPKLASWALKHVDGLMNCYDDAGFAAMAGEYDVAFRVTHFVTAYSNHVRWEYLRQHPRFLEVVNSVNAYTPKIELFAHHHPFLDNFLARTAVFYGQRRATFLHHIAGIPYGSNRFLVPRSDAALIRENLKRRRYVTLHNGFDQNFVISSTRATKCYPHFGQVVALLKAEFPELVFVQIGTSTSTPIDECDLRLIDKTTLDEAAGLIASAMLHIDNEGGLVHIAASLGTQAAVVFGPTPSDYFGYEENINLEPPVCGNCWWLARNWMDTCVKGYEKPRCVEDQAPGTVAKRLIPVIYRLLQGESLVQQCSGASGTSATDRVTA